MNKETRYRVAQAKAATIPVNSLDRSRLLKSLQVTLGKLRVNKKQQISVIAEATGEIQSINKAMKLINTKIAKLAPADGSIVTEHALLRYLERYHGVDLQVIHAEVLALPDTDRVMAHNTVITCFPTEDDHFNLAENERK